MYQSLCGLLRSYLGLPPKASNTHLKETPDRIWPFVMLKWLYHLQSGYIIADPINKMIHTIAGLPLVPIASLPLKGSIYPV